MGLEARASFAHLDWFHSPPHTHHLCFYFPSTISFNRKPELWSLRAFLDPILDKGLQKFGRWDARLESVLGNLRFPVGDQRYKPGNSAAIGGFWRFQLVLVDCVRKLWG